ncbi:MAG: TRAP transporter large permease subunit [Oscillospiraceae bacterium]|nr:TRAP transporter large permease subunit [Oscillospiraceae bacterium]
MTPLAVGFTVFLLMILFVFIGVPVCYSVIVFAGLGLYLVGGEPILTQQFTSGIFTLSANYTFTVMPLFMLVGILAGETGIAGGTFTCAKKWLGRFRGGLLYAVVGANAVFGACSGISSAGTIVFSRIAAPELKKAGYDESLSYGCIASAGALSSLIPPSTSILTFCILTDISIGTALITGTSGGIVLLLTMFVLIFATLRINPSKAPSVTDEDRNVSWKERLATLKLLGPILFLFLFIVGGAFFGWFTATVGGAVATCVIFVYALAKGMSFKRVMACFWDSCQMFASLYLIMLGGQIFSRLISITGMAECILGFIAELGLPGELVFILIVLFYGVCGCIMDCMSIIIITVPIIFPLLTGLGFNPFVICVVLVLCAELGCITPPMGLAVFTVASVLKESPGKIFKGVVPFVIAMLAAAIIAIFVPDIILWLPKLMGAKL